MLLANLALASCLVALTCTIHLVGLVGLTAVIRHRRRQQQGAFGTLSQGAIILLVVFALFALHSIEIWVYTLTYMILGEFGSLETAVYYSTSAFTTVGFGDVVISDGWRMLGAAESANGFLLIGWSTAFLVSLTPQVRAFEANIEHDADKPK